MDQQTIAIGITVSVVVIAAAIFGFGFLVGQAYTEKKYGQ